MSYLYDTQKIVMQAQQLLVYMCLEADNCGEVVIGLRKYQLSSEMLESSLLWTLQPLLGLDLGCPCSWYEPWYI